MTDLGQPHPDHQPPHDYHEYQDPFPEDVQDALADPTGEDLTDPYEGLDMGTVEGCAMLAQETLTHTLGTLGAPTTGQIIEATVEVLGAYTSHRPHPQVRYTTMALLDGKVMLVLDHEAWGWQMFAVTAPPCPLPGDRPTAPTDTEAAQMARQMAQTAEGYAVSDAVEDRQPPPKG